jgi:hypothetical protein
MALSDQLGELSVRAKKAEDRAVAARSEARTNLQREVQSAQEDLQAGRDDLRRAAEENRGKVAAWFNDVQKSWDDQVEAVRRDIASKKAEHDLHAAERRAEAAEDDAAFAIRYAYWAIEDAEYAVLDATLARSEADNLATAPNS